MDDLTLGQRWAFRALFFLLIACIAFAQLLPLDPGPGGLPGPDVMLLLTLAWLLRRPEAVPVTMIALLFLMADFLFMRPPGLWAVIVVIMTEMIRSRASGFRDMSFVVEWLMIAAFITVGTLAHVILQAVFFVDQPALGQTLIRLLATVLCYPLVVAFGARSFGLRKPVSGEFNPLGVRS